MTPILAQYWEFQIFGKIRHQRVRIQFAEWYSPFWNYSKVYLRNVIFFPLDAPTIQNNLLIKLLEKSVLSLQEVSNSRLDFPSHWLYLNRHIKSWENSQRIQIFLLPRVHEAIHEYYQNHFIWVILKFVQLFATEARLLSTEWFWPWTRFEGPCTGPIYPCSTKSENKW